MAVDNENVATTTNESKQATPTKKEAVSVGQRIKTFLREVMSEMKRTNWPTRDELVKFTVVVMFTVVVVAIYLAVNDFVAANITQRVFNVIPPRP